ncbi:MAG: DHS-like NAD/FAD-binding domain-containing protein, partial [Piptocephalis tieghemiana]
ILRANTLEAVADYIKETAPTKIIVLTGAGISTAAGIPDFRTPGTGLYDNLQQYDLPYAEAIFDIDYFRRKPEPFYTLAKALYPGNFTPTLSHYFVRMLAEKGILLRQYTQNIDTLERRAGMREEWLVEAHGSFHEAACVECALTLPSRDPDGRDLIREAIFMDSIPKCTRCSGVIKPKIVFFGEGLPLSYFSRMNEDFDHCDLLIVMGTSLQVQPFASLIDMVPDHTPRLLINLEKCGEGGRSDGFDFEWKRQKFQRDAFWQGKCDDGCLELARLLDMEGLLLATMRKHNSLLAKEEYREKEKEEKRKKEEERKEEEELVSKVAQLSVSE